MEAPNSGFSPAARILGLAHPALLVPEPVGRSGLEEMTGGGQHLVGELLQGRDVVQNPEPPAIGGHHQVVEVLLDRKPIHGRLGEIGLQRYPVPAVIEGHKEGVLGSEVEQARPNRILTDHVDIAEDSTWESYH